MLILCILGAAIDLENKYKPEHNLTQNWTHIARNSSIEIPTCIFTIITFQFLKTWMPRDKRIEVALTYIYGIGPARAAAVLEKTGINPDTRVKDLTEDQEAQLYMIAK